MFARLRLLGVDAAPLTLREIDWLLAEDEARETRSDFRAGIIATLLARAHGAKDVEPGDFFPSLKSEPRQQTPEEMYAAMVSAFRKSK